MTQPLPSKSFRVLDLGRLSYEAARAIQLATLESVVEGREDTLLLVEHEPILTFGANFHEENLLLSHEEYGRLGIELATTERGGDVTYHGPGQLVIYPIFHTKIVGQDLHKWLRGLEEVILNVLAELGLTGRRFPPHTGVWIEDKKVAAIGIKIRRWVSMHGIALNCDLDLAPFRKIVPCGIPDYGVTSVTEVLNRPFSIEEAKPLIIRSFEQVFDVTTLMEDRAPNS